MQDQNQTEFFVDSPQKEIIAPKNTWSELTENELISNKNILEKRLQQFKNTNSFQILQSAINELESLIAQRRKRV